jgi:hypothetical protein
MSGGPRLGDVHAVGGALAVYWPDGHPCGPDPERDGKPWVLLHDFGGVSYVADLTRQDKIGNIQDLWPGGNTMNKLYISENGWEEDENGELRQVPHHVAKIFYPDTNAGRALTERVAKRLMHDRYASYSGLKTWDTEDEEARDHFRRLAAGVLDELTRDWITGKTRREMLAEMVEHDVTELNKLRDGKTTFTEFTRRHNINDFPESPRG